MKKFNIGAQITTREEAKILVENIIDSAEEKFTASLIKKLAFNYMAGSKLKLTQKAVDQMVDDVLYEQSVNGAIACISGSFVKQHNATKSL